MEIKPIKKNGGKNQVEKEWRFEIDNLNPRGW